MALLVSNVAWTKDGDSVEALCKHLHVKPAELIEFELLKRSVDARRRPPVWQADYRVVLKDEDRILAKSSMVSEGIPSAMQHAISRFNSI